MAAATIVTSIVTGGSNNAATTSEQANAYATDFVSQGVVGATGNTSSFAPATGGYAVNQDSSPDMGVTVTAGVAYVTATPTSQGSQVMRAKMSANYTAYTINSNSSGSTKYDWVYLSVSATNAANPAVGSDNVTSLMTSRSTSVSTDTGSPPTYGTLLAVVTVINGASSITNANISDRRTVANLSNGNQNTTNGWQVLNYPLSYSANNGNKEFVVTTPNDLTGTLNPGTRLKISRSVTPASQCMSFSSNQYASKSSPSGISFTSAFTCEAWINLTSYGTGQIVSRTDTTSGWFFSVQANGQLAVGYYTSGNLTQINSFASIPLNKWTHVAVAVTSVSSKTALIYMNGIPITTFVQTGNTTTLTQGTAPLEIGGYNGANQNINALLSEVRVWSVAQSQSSIQGNMGISLVGNETNLAALFPGAGSFNDSTSNGNNLTAANGALATQSGNPYNAIEYALVTKISYSNPTTTLTLFTGDSGTIPNLTLNSPYYSSEYAPFGFPTDSTLWHVRTILKTDCTQSSPSANTWYNISGVSGTTGGAILSVPTGAWIMRYGGLLYATKPSTTLIQAAVTLSSANNSESDPNMTSAAQVEGASGQMTVADTVTRTGRLSLSAQALYYLNYRTTTSSTSSVGNLAGSFAPTTVVAESAYI